MQNGFFESILNVKWINKYFKQFFKIVFPALAKEKFLQKNTEKLYKLRQNLRNPSFFVDIRRVTLFEGEEFLSFSNKQHYSTFPYKYLRKIKNL